MRLIWHSKSAPLEVWVVLIDIGNCQVAEEYVDSVWSDREKALDRLQEAAHAAGAQGGRLLSQRVES